MTERPATRSEERRPGVGRKVLASLVSALAIAAVLYGCVGLLTLTSLNGLLAAGVVFVGGGLTLARLSWRLYRGLPGAWALAEGRTPEEARAAAREHARAAWLRAAVFLLALVPVYLLIALVFADSEAALGAAALVAVTSAGLGLLTWLQGRKER